MIYSKLLIPIVMPQNEQLKFIKLEEDYFFSRDVFQLYKLTREEEIYDLYVDCYKQWYLLWTIECENLDELKSSRQILRPTYMKDSYLPTVNLLEKLGLFIQTNGFDKAYGHALYYSSSLENLTYREQLQIANYDNLDDPEVCSHIHYVQSVYQQQKTHFVSGVETKSFATITESNYYAKHIWPTITGTKYLLLFAFYNRYTEVPSEQMLPRLLINLWESTNILSSSTNNKLFICRRL